MAVGESDGEGGTRLVSCVPFPVQIWAQCSGGLLRGRGSVARCVDTARGCSSEWPLLWLVISCVSKAPVENGLPWSCLGLTQVGGPGSGFSIRSSSVLGVLMWAGTGRPCWPAAWGTGRHYGRLRPGHRTWGRRPAALPRYPCPFGALGTELTQTGPCHPCGCGCVKVVGQPVLQPCCEPFMLCAGTQRHFVKGDHPSTLQHWTSFLSFLFASLVHIMCMCEGCIIKNKFVHWWCNSDCTFLLVNKLSAQLTLYASQY